MADQPQRSLALIEGRFRLLRRMALDAASGADLKNLLTTALKESLSLSGIEAGSVSLLGEKGEVEWSVLVGEKSCAARLGELEKTLLSDLRMVHRVRSVYMTIDRDGPAGVFSYPLKAGAIIYGTISGLARGERNLAVEEEFISATAAVMALATERDKQPASAGPDSEVVKAARTAAITETAVAINHQINNPLTAISGNVQLLLSRAEELSPDVVHLLKKIEEGADRILEVTSKLRKLTTDKTVRYVGDTAMIDLDASSSPRKKDQE